MTLLQPLPTTTIIELMRRFIPIIMLGMSVWGMLYYRQKEEFKYRIIEGIFLAGSYTAMHDFYQVWVA